MKIRRVKIHIHDRDKTRLSRYQLINWAFREVKLLNKLNRIELHKRVDNHLDYLLHNCSPMQIAEVVRIWCRMSEVTTPTLLTNFGRFHQRCGSIVIRKEVPADEDSTRPFFLYAKNRAEFLTRVRVIRHDMPDVIRDFLKNQTGYSPMSEAEYVELKQAINNHLTNLKYNPALETFDINEWRLKRVDGILDRIYGLPE